MLTDQRSPSLSQLFLVHGSNHQVFYQILVMAFSGLFKEPSFVKFSYKTCYQKVWRTKWIPERKSDRDWYSLFPGGVTSKDFEVSSEFKFKKYLDYHSNNYKIYKNADGLDSFSINKVDIINYYKVDINYYKFIWYHDKN